MPTPVPEVFCDLDGVLCDFDGGVLKELGSRPNQLRKMWTGLARANGFYANLEWMPDGRELWEGIEHLTPTILTGLPRGYWAEPQKRRWCERELGNDVAVITCMSRDKHLHCREPGSVLIDDRLALQEEWKKAGGVFIHHTSARSSLESLHAVLKSGKVDCDPSPNLDS